MLSLVVMDYTQWDYVVLSLPSIKSTKDLFYFSTFYFYIFFAFSIADKRTFQIVFSFPVI